MLARLELNVFEAMNFDALWHVRKICHTNFERISEDGLQRSCFNVHAEVFKKFFDISNCTFHVLKHCSKISFRNAFTRKWCRALEPEFWCTYVSSRSRSQNKNSGCEIFVKVSLNRSRNSYKKNTANIRKYWCWKSKNFHRNREERFWEKSLSLNEESFIKTFSSFKAKFANSES